MGETAYCPADDRLSIWCARPAPHLTRYVTGYDAYHAWLAPGEEARDVLPPAWPAVRIALDGFEWGMRIGTRTIDPGPSDALFGPSSRIAFTRYTAGRCVCAGLTPLGWARFVRRDAAAFANRATPLDAVWPDRVASLRTALAGADDSAAVFDAFFTELLERTEPEDERLDRVLSLLLDPNVVTIAQLAARADIDPRHLARLSTRHFGFTPKLLLRRARFMRALVEAMRVGRGSWKTLAADAGYHDQPHFIRDCQLFLGMPISVFIQRPKPLFELSLALRAAVLGTPAQVLHAPVAGSDHPWNAGEVPAAPLSDPA